MDRTQLRSVLGDELFALANDLPSGVVDIEPLVGRGPRSSFRLTLADGQVLKAKRLANAADARRVAALLHVLGHPAFPTVLRRRGASILTPWIPGRSLDRTDTDADLLRTCGAIHAVIHCQPAPSGATRVRWRSRTDREARLQRDLDALVDAGWLARGEAAAALVVADRHAPEDWGVGIVHNDFHAENMIRTAADGVVVVDNETMSIGALAYDLARTWYRWPMSEAQRVAYLEGYRRLGSTEELEHHFPFWVVTVLARGAAFRLRAGRCGIAEPIARLREQLEIRD
ncbi:MAG: aminoglycoside phosphotransferase family protein [Solirubrobacteraceae bacterium]